MLKGLFGKSGKATATPLLTTAIPPCYAQLYRADGTLPTSDFTSLVVPMFERVREAAGDAEFQVLIETISAALNRAANVRFPLGRPGTADDMVGPAVFLASDMSAYVTGAIIMADGGYRAI